MQLERLFQEEDPAVTKALAALSQEIAAAVDSICSNVSLSSSTCSSFPVKQLASHK